MKNLLYISLVIAVLFACSKDKRITNKVEGNWELIHVKYYDNEGILHLPTFSGELNTVKTSESQLSYEQNLSFNLQGNLLDDSHTGQIKVIEKGQKMEVSVTTTDTSYIAEYVIIMLTNTDFGFEFFDINGNKRVYTFKKI